MKLGCSTTLRVLLLLVAVLQLSRTCVAGWERARNSAGASLERHDGTVRLRGVAPRTGVREYVRLTRESASSENSVGARDQRNKNPRSESQGNSQAVRAARPPSTTGGGRKTAEIQPNEDEEDDGIESDVDDDENDGVEDDDARNGATNEDEKRSSIPNIRFSAGKRDRDRERSSTNEMEPNAAHAHLQKADKAPGPKVVSIRRTNLRAREISRSETGGAGAPRATTIQRPRQVPSRQSRGRLPPQQPSQPGSGSQPGPPSSSDGPGVAHDPRSKATRTPVVGGGSVEREEMKVKAATLKLVIWLRNRLRKRLVEARGLESDMRNEKERIANLTRDQTRIADERQAEIRSKIEQQKRLVKFRRQSAGPEEQMRIVRQQNTKLELQLHGLEDTYRSLVVTYHQVEQKVRQAGFSHWLDSRGKRYMPETAVGVLSKSTELIDPVIHGLGKAVEMDQEIANEVDGLVPVPHSRLFAGVLSDLLVLVPVVPILAVGWRFTSSMHGLSLSHHILLLSAVIACQSLANFLISLIVAEEAFSFFQRENEPIMVGILFLTGGLYLVYCSLLFLDLMVRGRSATLVQLVLASAGTAYFYATVFRLAVLDHAITFPALGHAVYGVLGLLAMTETNRDLKLNIPLQHDLDYVIHVCTSWLRETAAAMREALCPDSDTAEGKRSEIDPLDRRSRSRRRSRWAKPRHLDTDMMRDAESLIDSGDATYVYVASGSSHSSVRRGDGASRKPRGGRTGHGRP